MLKNGKTFVIEEVGEKMIGFMAEHLTEIITSVGVIGVVFALLTIMFTKFDEKKAESRWTHYFYLLFLLAEEILPLLGTLGTVAGLLMLKDDASKMQDGFLVALDTTFWGLFLCILLKIIDAVLIQGVFLAEKGSTEHKKGEE